MVVTSGYDSGLLSQTESLSIGDNSDPPIYPDHPRRIYAATGGFLNKNFITCGGFDLDQDPYVDGYTNKCYLLGSEAPFATMMTKRRDAASIILEHEKLYK